MRTNYIIACWSGARRDGNKIYEQDCSIYLKRHLQILDTIEHRLSQITIVISNNSNESEVYTSYINSISDTIKTANIIILRRENIGQSYGSWSYAYGLYRTAFDHYIFMEDDYVPVKDNFDTILINELGEKNGFLCSLAVPPIPSCDHPHAAISNGIAKSEDLEKIWNQFGKLLHGDNITDYNDTAQTEFSRGFLALGMSIYDLTDKYRAPFNGSSPYVGEKLLFYGDINKEDLIIPIQFLNNLLPQELLYLLK